MKKRIFSVLLLLALCLSLSVPVSAKEVTNLIPEGSFDSPEDISRIRSPQVSTLVEWDKEGATKNPGSYKHSPASTSRYVYWDVMTLAGETYDISFYAKNAGVASKFHLYTVFEDTNSGNETPLRDVAISSQWRKYEFTWTPPETVSKTGEKVYGPTSFCIRLQTSETTDTLWIDEIKIVPHGNIDVSYDVVPYKGDWVDPLAPEKQSETVKFSDCTNHWAENNLKALATAGYINGVGNGKFLPDNTVTRAEFVTMISNVIKVSGVTYKNIYSDVAKDAYYANNVQTAYQLGVINPVITIGNKFLPNQPITREEAASMLLRASNLYDKANGEKKVSFDDADKIADWAKEEVTRASQKGLILGDEKGNFNPQNPITRAEAATLVLRLVEKNARLAVFVDPVSGNDAENGTAEAPVKTIGRAQELVRKGIKNMNHNIFVFLKYGEHYIDKTLQFTPEDSGQNGYNVVYTSYGDGDASLTMGKHFSGFELYDSTKNIYRTYIGKTDSRQVYIDGVKATRAKSEGHHGLSDVVKTETGYTTTDTHIADFAHPEDLEFIYYDHWTQSRGQVDSVSKNGELLEITMSPTWYKAASNRGGSSVTIPEWYENAYELLDNPGEWFINKYDGYLYYMPRHFEKPDEMVATIPIGERMMNVEGESADNVIHNIVFDGVCFEYTTWLELNEKGLNERQENIVIRSDAEGTQIGLEMPETAIYVSNARYVDFTNCTFRKLAATGVQMFNAIQDCNVVGNEFYEIGSTAFSLGQVAGDYLWTQHINPMEYKYYIINNKFNNNYVHEVATEHGAAAAISASFPKNSEIKNNDIGNVIYSGMHIGWGWAEYRFLKTATYDFDITNNYIYEVMNDKVYDGGAIYTIGYTSGTKENPNLMKENFLQTQRNMASYFYTDEGSTNWSIEDNVVDNSRVDYWDMDGERKAPVYIKFYRSSIYDNVAKNNYTNVDNIQFVTGNEYYDNKILKNGDPWPEKAQKIIENSGVQGEYAEKFSDGIRYIRSVRNMFIASGETQKMPVNAYGRKYTEYDVPDGVYYISSRPDIATVDENGNITAVGAGTTEISAYLKNNDQILTTRTEVVCGGTVEKISLGRDTFTLVEGYDVNIAPEVLTSLGEKRYLSASIRAKDNTILEVNEASGKMKGLKAGETELDVVYHYGAEEIKKTYPVTVLPAENPEALKLPTTKPDSGFFDVSNWSDFATKSGNGIEFRTPSAYAMSKSTCKGLLNFDINIDETSSSGWPAVAFSADGNTHSNGDVYMIGFKGDIIEVQRFNKGSRTVIFGTALSNYLAGSGIPREVAGYEYRKTHNVTIGVIPEENGARIVLNIDDVNVMDYLDTEAGALIQEEFYPIIYAKTSTIQITPAK